MLMYSDIALQYFDENSVPILCQGPSVDMKQRHMRQITLSAEPKGMGFLPCGSLGDSLLGISLHL